MHVPMSPAEPGSVDLAYQISEEPLSDALVAFALDTE